MPSIIAAFLVIFVSLSVTAKIDDSIEIFFPKSLGYLQSSQTEFSIFWWNFIVIEPRDGKVSFEDAAQICSVLEKLEGHEIKRRICGDDLSGMADTLLDWSNDMVLREKFSEESAKTLLSEISGALIEIGFLSSAQKDVFRLKRHDPLDQWQVYLKKNQSMGTGTFQRQQGFLFDPITKNLIIPIQFILPPKMKNAESTLGVLENFKNAHLVGAHGSAYSNENQVHQDLNIVSIVGLTVLLAFIALLLLKRRMGALLLFPPVAVAMVIAAWITEILFGSIHGLTLAFGSGIVGLAVDYGLHGAFNLDSHQTWKSNSIGFLTTSAGLLVLALSGIPLIRQMMIFATLGIFLGFLFYYLLCRYLPKYFLLRPIDFNLWNFRYSGFIIIGLIVFGILGSFKANLSFDLRDFNYQKPGDKDATNWFFSQGEQKEMFLQIHDKYDLFGKVQNEAQWSMANNLSYIGIGEYLTDPLTQMTNAKTWQNEGCLYFKKNLTETELKVFSPFVDNICRTRERALSFEDIQKKEYLNHLAGKNQVVSLFLSKSPEDKKLIHKKWPQAQSLTESIRGFSDSLKSDLNWMIPAILVLSTLILALYYRNAFYVFAVYIPFLSGLGLFLLVSYIRGTSLDLISVLGLLMVFGFSVDYGVFVTDIFAFPNKNTTLPVIYSVLGLAAFTNIIGFFPMLFAKHPILNQLGSALFFGTIGTFLGTRWGLESFLELKPIDLRGVKKSLKAIVLFSVLGTSACTSQPQRPDLPPNQPLQDRNLDILLFPEGSYKQEVVVNVLEAKQTQNFEFNCVVKKDSQETLLYGYNSFGFSLFKIREKKGQPIEAESSVEQIQQNKDFFIRIFNLVKLIYSLKRSDPGFQQKGLSREIQLQALHQGQSLDVDVSFAHYDALAVPLEILVKEGNKYRVRIKTNTYKLANSKS